MSKETYEEIAKGYTEMGELNLKLSECDSEVSEDITIFKKEDKKEAI